MNSIEVKNLTKKFGKFISVNDISFNVEQGEVFGFLGANGAGKSTTIKMLCGILSSTSGDAMVGGYSINKQPELVKRQIGYMSQKFSLYNDLTVEENIDFFGGVYGLENDILKRRKEWVLEIANLNGKEKILTDSLAVGFKQRLALGCAVIHEPKIVFLDEPTGGVDPVSRRKFWDLINTLSQQGVTVFVTTHYLDEAEFCNRIIMINEGKLIAGGSPEELKKKYINSSILEIECDNVNKAIELLDDMPFVKSSSFFSTYIHVTLSENSEDESEGNKISEIKNILSDKNNINVSRIEKILPSLEDVFINLLDKGSAKDAQ
jgi:ABC-2 type transport system ATP-binding protein